jgi:hypothetical protein
MHTDAAQHKALYCIAFNAFKMENLMIKSYVYK